MKIVKIGDVIKLDNRKVTVSSIPASNRIEIMYFVGTKLIRKNISLDNNKVKM